MFAPLVLYLDRILNLVQHIAQPLERDTRRNSIELVMSSALLTLLALERPILVPHAAVVTVFLARRAAHLVLLERIII